jgi:hypothetical protein
MNSVIKFCSIVLMMMASPGLRAQDTSRLHFTTGAGIIKSPGSLRHVLHPSVAFNSGLELILSNNWFLQGTLDFNSLKYNQRVKEGGSPYLFQNTNSSLFMFALNAGKNYFFGENKWLASFYGGAGYLNIGEPRLIDRAENIIRQQVIRKPGVFAKAGGRIGYKTTVQFLQIIYFDASYWASPVEVQGSKLNGVSLFLGARMSVN